MKKFNTTGPCFPNIHYMVNLSKRLEEIKAMVDAGEYFTINRARQYGKTTTLAAMAENLSPEYLVVSLDFQNISKAAYQSKEAFVKAFSRMLLRKRRQSSMPDRVAESLKEFVERKEDKAVLDELFETLAKWCELSPQPIVLLIDEVDTAANNQVFLDFLAQLRAGYIERNQVPSFHSVVLAGVTDVKATPHNSWRTSCLHNISSYCPKILDNTRSIPEDFQTICRKF